MDIVKNEKCSKAYYNKYFKNVHGKLLKDYSTVLKILTD